MHHTYVDRSPTIYYVIVRPRERAIERIVDDLDFYDALDIADLTCGAVAFGSLAPGVAIATYAASMQMRARFALAGREFVGNALLWNCTKNSVGLDGIRPTWSR